jgi:hypothetical protein
MWLLVVYILNVLVGESIVIAMVWVWTELFRMPAYQYLCRYSSLCSG